MFYASPMCFLSVNLYCYFPEANYALEDDVRKDHHGAVGIQIAWIQILFLKYFPTKGHPRVLIIFWVSTCFPCLTVKFATSFCMVIWSLYYLCVANNQLKDCLPPMLPLPPDHCPTPQAGCPFFFPAKVICFTFFVILFCPAELVMAQHPAKPLSPCCSKAEVTDLTFQKVQHTFG